jgi:hypothetical protein
MVSGFWFPVSGFWFLEKKPFSVGRASVPAQVSPRPQSLFSWFAGDRQVMAISQKIQWSLVSGQLIVVLCQKIETTGQPLSVFSAHGSRLTAHGRHFHGSRVTGRSWQLVRKCSS